MKFYIHHNDNPDTREYLLHNVENYKDVEYEFTDDWSKNDGVHLIDYKFYCLENGLITTGFVEGCFPKCFEPFFNFLNSFNKSGIKIHVLFMESEYKKKTLRYIGGLDKNVFRIFWDKVPTGENLPNPYDFLFTHTFKTFIMPVSRYGLNRYKETEDNFKEGKYYINFPIRTRKSGRIRLRNKIINYNNSKFISTLSNPEWGQPNPDLEINSSHIPEENMELYLDKIIPLSRCTLIAESFAQNNGLTYLTEKTITHLLIKKPFVYCFNMYNYVVKYVFGVDLNRYGNDEFEIVSKLNEITSNEDMWDEFITKESEMVSRLKSILDFRLSNENSYFECVMSNSEKRKMSLI
jgi:hypothetical protein